MGSSQTNKRIHVKHDRVRKQHAFWHTRAKRIALRAVTQPAAKNTKNERQLRGSSYPNPFLQHYVGMHRGVRLARPCVLHYDLGLIH